MGKSKSKSTATIDPQLKAEYLANLERARSVAGNLGAREIAGFTPDWYTGAQGIRNNAYAGLGAVQQGINTAGGVANYNPMMIGAPQGQATLGNRGDIRNVVAGSFPQGNLDAYMNPYIDNVIDRSMADLQRQRGITMQDMGDRAAAAGAFGGSRHGVTEAETNRGFYDVAANTAAGLRSQGFDTAAQMMQQDYNRALAADQMNQGMDWNVLGANLGFSNQFGLANMESALQAALANQRAGLQGQQLNLAGAGMLGSLGAQQQQMGLTGSGALQNLGLAQQNFTQQQLDSIRNLPLEQQQIINTALAMYPSIGSQSTSQRQGLGGSLLGAAGMALAGPLGAGLFGAGTAGAGLAGAATGGTLSGMAGLGGGGLFGIPLG